MHTYIDEAGAFVVPPNRKLAVSCVGALTIRNEDVNDIFAKFRALKAAWGITENTEYKGSQLDEVQVRQVINLLCDFPVIFDVTAIDMATQTNSSLTQHKITQAKRITENLTDEFHPNFIQEVYGLREGLEKLPNQLYVQAFCTFELLYRVVQMAALYYAQRFPIALSDFYWFVDAKNHKITPYEELWAKIILPVLQSKSLREPFIQLIGADYSYFEKYCSELERPPEHLREVVGDVEPFQYIEIRDVYMKNLSFEQSHKNLGIQLADILTTTVRRAMNGNLQKDGWGNIGRLMVQAPKYSHAIQIIDLSSTSQTGRRQKKPPYGHVISAVNAFTKGMLVKV